MESTILAIHSKRIEPKFVVRSTYEDLYEDKQIGEMVRAQRALIVLRNCITGREVVHPLSSFILDKWKSSKYNTQRQRANQVVCFINYIMINNAKEFGINSLSEIEFYHGTLFLNYLTSKGNKKSTVKRHESILSEFYYYLTEKNLLKKIRINQFTKGYNKKYSEYIESPFKEVVYNNKRGKKVIHDIKPEFVIPLLETAYQEAPMIALGVYYQLFGGFRVGDAVNTTRDSITCIEPFGEFGQVIDIVQRDLRRRTKNSDGSNYVKKEREQYVFPYKKMLSFLYKEHLKKYISIDGINALFLNTKGEAMSGATYRYYFTKIQKKFLHKLNSINETKTQNYVQFLKSVKWSTHIGRGIFSNSVAEIANTALELANARGDSTVDASLIYIENTSRLEKKLEQYLEKMYTGNYFYNN